MGLLFGEDKFGIFYQTPDGEDVVSKAIHGAKWGAVIAAFPGILVVSTMTKKPQTALAIMMALGEWVVPGAVAGASGVTAVQLSGRLRGADDEYNHIIGGVVSAAAIGARARSCNVAFAWSIPFALGAAMAKSIKMNGHSLNPAKFAPGQSLGQPSLMFNHGKNSLFYNRRDLGPLK